MSLTLLVIAPSAGVSTPVIAHAKAVAEDLHFDALVVSDFPDPPAGDGIHWVTMIQEGRTGRPYHVVVTFTANAEPLNPDQLRAVTHAVGILDRADWGPLSARRREIVTA